MLKRGDEALGLRRLRRGADIPEERTFDGADGRRRWEAEIVHFFHLWRRNDDGLRDGRWSRTRRSLHAGRMSFGLLQSALCMLKFSTERDKSILKRTHNRSQCSFMLGPRNGVPLDFRNFSLGLFECLRGFVRLTGKRRDGDCVSCDQGFMLSLGNRRFPNLGKLSLGLFECLRGFVGLAAQPSDVFRVASDKSLVIGPGNAILPELVECGLGLLSLGSPR